MRFKGKQNGIRKEIERGGGGKGKEQGFRVGRVVRGGQAKPY